VTSRAPDRGRATDDADPLVERLADSLRREGFEGARVAVVLGSGLGAFATRLPHSRTVSFADLECMPVSRVPGHAGELAIGDIGGVRVLVQQGRVHLYEGWSARDVTRSVRAFARLGVRALVLTNAAGGLHGDWRPGMLMRIRDHINLQGATPLGAREIAHGSPYDPELASAIDRSACDVDCELRSGVYAALTGPAYETAAEIRMLAWIGADAVGMSTAMEAVAAHASGMRVAALSCITNAAAGIGASPPSHEEVLRAGRDASESFVRLLEASVPAIARNIAG
jgi:purine-nucleoside phosphorylase